jgi:hypothetical protein
MNEEAKEELGKLIDSLDNLTYSLNMSLPDSLHVSALRSALPELVKNMKEQYEKAFNENVWNI